MTDRPLRWLTAVAVLVLCVAGCAGLGVSTPKSSGKADCSWLTSPVSPQSGGTPAETVVMIDASASFWPKAGAPAELPNNLVQSAAADLMSGYGGGGTQLVSLGVFGGSSSTVDWQFSRVPFRAPIGGDAEVSAQRLSTQKCLADAVTGALRTAPQVAGTDEMAAVAAAGQQLQGTSPSHDQVVLFTDGLSNVGCLNLSKVIRQGQQASKVLAGCQDHADLAELKGVAVRLYGVGFQAASPSLSSAEQTWLENYWRAVCGALHVASPASCVAPSGPTVVRTSATPRPADPAIAFPVVRPGEPLNVPSDLLFGFDSAVLSPAGQSYLDIVLDQVKGQDRTVKEVIGHTDAVGGADYNMGLSERRADAVQSYLASRGFTGVHAAGMGESDPVCSPQYTPAHVAIPACMAKDRRVQIILGG